MRLRKPAASFPAKYSVSIAQPPELRLADDDSNRYRPNTMTKREKLDPSWHKARVAARIWLKAKQGRPLSARQKRLARIMGNDPVVTDELIHAALQPLEVEMVARAWSEKRRLSYEPRWLNSGANPTATFSAA